MSEYWVSHKKYFCRYCEIYIADDAPSRRMHENGLRHKGNMDRFIRGLYKSGEKKKKELDEEKREMARVELAAQAAFAQDVGSGIAKAVPPSKPVVSTSTAPRKPTQKPSNPYANYSTPASLGYQDPDVEKLRVEAEMKRTQGVAGDWEVITPTTQPVPDAPLSGPDPSTADVSGTLKREADSALDAENSRHFKLRKKTLGVGLGEIYDPGMIPIKLKKKEEVEVVSGGDVVQTPEVIPAEVAAAPKWTKVKWKPAGEEVTCEADSNGVVPDRQNEQANVAGSPGIKPEPDTKLEAESHPDPPSQGEISVKLENTPSLFAPESGGGGNLFRKRKVPGGTVKTRRQI